MDFVRLVNDPIAFLKVDESRLVEGGADFVLLANLFGSNWSLRRLALLSRSSCSCVVLCCVNRLGQLRVLHRRGAFWPLLVMVTVSVVVFRPDVVLLVLVSLLQVLKQVVHQWIQVLLRARLSTAGGLGCFRLSGGIAWELLGLNRVEFIGPSRNLVN